MSVHKKGGTKIYLFPSNLTANPREIMKKYLLLILSIFVSLSISAQCLGEDCSIKGRNKAAKKKAIKMTGSKRGGRAYTGTKRKKGSGSAFDPFSGGKSKKSSAGGFDPFEAESKRKKGKGAGGFDPFADSGKKRKGSRGSAFDPFADGDRSSRSKKGGGYDPFDNDNKRKGVSSGGFDPFSKGKKKLRNASSGYDGWDTGSSRKKGRGSANDSWLGDSKEKHGATGGGYDPFGGKRSRKVSNSGGGTWAMGGASKRSSGGGGNDSWDKSFTAGTAPPSYQSQDDIATSYDEFGSSSFSTDVVFNRPHYWKYTAYVGQILKHSDKVNLQLGSEATRPVLGAEIAYEIPTQGDRNWHHFFNMPSYGYALTYLNLGQDERLGSAIAFYPYVDIPLFRSKVVDLNFSNGFGVSYVTKFDKTSSDSTHIDPTTNGSHLIGSPVNVFLKTGLNFSIRPVPTIRSDKDEYRSRYTINAGVSMLHLSNGSFSSPNTGINMLAANISLKHTPMPVSEVLRQTPEDLLHVFTLDVMGTAGLRELSVLDTRKFIVGNLNVAGYYQVHNIYRVGLGIDGFFDEVYQETHKFEGASKYDSFYANSTYKDGDIINSIRGGVCLSNELVLGRTTFALDGGYYVFDNIKADEEQMYFRAALKYRFTKHFFGALALKTHGTYAEFLTLGFGYSIPLY